MNKLTSPNIAPDFKVESTIGNISLSHFKDNQVVLYFYPKDMTPGYTTQAIEFTELYAEFKKRNVKVIGVSRDSISSHNAFVVKHNIPYPLISDTESKVCKLYNVTKEKSSFGKK